jgi:DedD protein
VKYTLKHRLIGAAVLAAVAVLLLPGFLKEKKDYPVSTRSQIPAQPAMVAEEFKPPQPVPNIEPAPAPDTMFVPNEPAPEPVVAAASPAASAVTASAAATVAKSAGASSKAQAQTSSVPTMPLNAQGLPEAWVVQVGSFTSKEAANKLRDDLQADGQKAYVRTVVSNGNSISRVYIGPKLDRAQAIALKEQMDKRLQQKTMVMKFQP